MTLKQFLDMYDNWNGTLVINDGNLEQITKGKVLNVMQDKGLHDMPVMAFGFYDGELCVRVK